MDRDIYCPYCNEVIDFKKDCISPNLYECPSCGETLEVKESVMTL